MRQDHPKTVKSRRTVAIPSFTAEAARRRLTLLEDTSPNTLLFCSREGTPLTTNNVRRQLRHVLDLAGITGVTPHMFRSTVATAINKQAGVDLAAKLLGHTDPKITILHYIVCGSSRASDKSSHPDTLGPQRRNLRRAN